MPPGHQGLRNEVGGSNSKEVGFLPPRSWGCWRVLSGLQACGLLSRLLQGSTSLAYWGSPALRAIGNGSHLHVANALQSPLPNFLLFVTTTTCTAAVRGYYFPHSLGEGMEDLETQRPNKAGTPVFWLLDHEVGGSSSGNPSWPHTFSKPQFIHH